VAVKSFYSKPESCRVIVSDSSLVDKILTAGHITVRGIKLKAYAYKSKTSTGKIFQNELEDEKLYAQYEQQVQSNLSRNIKV
jgi:hypothetical protein